MIAKFLVTFASKSLFRDVIWHGKIAKLCTIEKRILKFILKGLNSNSVCANLLQVKLTCKNSCFADNYRFLSHKHNISSSDWTNDITILLKILEIKFHSIQCISDAATVKELCKMRDNADFNLLSSSEITKLIDDICIN